MTSAEEQSRQRSILLLSLLTAVLIPLIPIWGHFGFSTPDEIVLGVLLFIAFLLLDVFRLAGRVESREERAERLWTVRDRCDSDLLGIRSGFAQITNEAYGDEDLFVAHFTREIHRLSESIKEVAERRQLEVQADHFLNVDNVLDAFRGDASPIWRYTWPIGDDSRLFEELTWKRYFERTVRLVEQGALKGVRIVLVLEDSELLRLPRVQKLLDFFQTNRGFECFTVTNSDFRSICRDNRVEDDCIDFGIYGNRLLFLTTQYDPAIRGTFVKDATKIEHYRHLFDSIWGPVVARKNPSRATERVTLEALYEFDEGQPKESSEANAKNG